MKLLLVVLSILTAILLGMPHSVSYADGPASGTVSEARARAEAQTKLAVARLKRGGDVKTAQDALIAATKVDPTYPMPLFYLGALAERQNDTEAAIKWYEGFCKLDQTSDYYVQAQLRLDDLKKSLTPEGKRNKQYNAALAQAQQSFSAKNYAGAADQFAAAEKVDANRWEAYFMRGDCLAMLHRYAEASDEIKRALVIAPPEKKALLQKALDRANSDAKSMPQAAAQPPATQPAAPTAAQDRLALVELQQITDDLRKPHSDDERHQLLEDMFVKSGDYVFAHPDAEKVWELRAVSAFELYRPMEAGQAAKKMQDLGASAHGSDAELEIIGKIDREGWIQLFQNSGSRFDQLWNAARSGDPHAMQQLGDAYLNGDWVGCDSRVAGRWYQKAIAVEKADAYISAEYCKDPAKQITLFTEAAEAGNSAAMNNIGWRYQLGAAVTQDYAKAMIWYRKAANAGNADAMNNIGWLYQNGQGVPQDFAQAMSWFRKAADAGNSDAMYGVGVLYQNGQGVPQDFAQAMSWYRKAADAGNSDATNNIGVLYQNGQGVPQDFAQAMSWYRKAADAGISDAMNNIGWLYQNGQGVPQDHAMARQWMQKAAAAGLAPAKDWLAKNP